MALNSQFFRFAVYPLVSVVPPGGRNMLMMDRSVWLFGFSFAKPESLDGLRAIFEMWGPESNGRIEIWPEPSVRFREFGLSPFYEVGPFNLQNTQDARIELINNSTQEMRVAVLLHVARVYGY